MEHERRLPHGALVKALTKPLRLRSNSKSFFVATARREIHGDRLHRTELPPTLQGFFYGYGQGHGSREVNNHEGMDLMPSQEFLRFAAGARTHARGEVIYNEVDDDDDEEEEEDDDEEEDMLPRQEFGRFASILGASATPVMDPSFSFLSKTLQESEHIFLVDSCNGLVLFGLLRDAYYTTQELGYIVCNPATEQWVRVPSCSWNDDDPSMISLTTHTSLLFDPAVSSHFELVLFWENIVGTPLTRARTRTFCYSSEIGIWSHNIAADHWGEQRHGSLEGWRHREITHNSPLCGFPSAFVHGLLYLILERKQVLQVDAHGNTRRIIPAPHLVHVRADNYVVFIGQSQGLLHCIVEQGHEENIRPGYRRKWRSCGLSVWVLQDSDVPQWALKHQMSNLELFEKRSCEAMVDYHVVAMHPDCNLVFFVRHRDAQMLSYDMDRRKVQALHSFRNDYGSITLGNSITLTPYVPYLSRLFVGVASASK